MAIAASGNAGTGSSNASGTTLVFNSSGTMDVGNVGILTVISDNVVTTTGPSSQHASVSSALVGTWTKLDEYTYSPTGAVNDGITASIWRFESTGSVAATPVTVTFASAVNEKCASMYRYTVASGMTLALGTGFTNPIINTAAAGVASFGSVTFSGLPNLSRLYFRGLGRESNATGSLTVSTGYTQITVTRSSTGPSSAVIVRGEFRINTSTTETSNPSIAASGDSVGIFYAFEEKSLSADVSVGLNSTGAGATGARGIPAPATAALPTGKEATGSVGTLTAVVGSVNVSVALTGVSATGARGDLTPSGGDVSVEFDGAFAAQAFAATVNVTVTDVAPGTLIPIALGVFGTLTAPTITTDQSDDVEIAEIVPDTDQPDGYSAGAYILSANGGDTVITAVATGAGLMGIIAHKVSGVDAFDGSDGFYEPSTTATDGVDCGTVTPTLAGDKYGFSWSLDKGNNTRPNAGTGQTNVVTGATSIIGTQFKIITGLSAFAPKFTETDTGSHMMSGVMVFGISAGAGGDVSVGLTNVLATVSRGTLVPSAAIVLANTNVLATTARGIVTADVARALINTSVLATAARGTVSPGTAVIPTNTNVLATTARGTITSGITSALNSTNVLATTGFGIVSPALATGALLGKEATGQYGTLAKTSAIVPTNTNVLGTTEQGTVTVEGAADVTIALTTVFSTVLRGVLGEQHSGSLQLTTKLATTEIGTASPRSDIETPLTGVEATVVRGVLGETHSSTVGITTVLATGQRGTLTETHSGSVGLTFVLGTGTRGTLSETHSGTLALTNTSATTGFGSISTTGGDSPNKTVALSGVAGTTAHGTISTTSSLALTGQGATASPGVPVVKIDVIVALTTVGAAANSGLVAEIHSGAVAVSTVAAAGQRGTLGCSRTIPLTTVPGTATDGILTEIHSSVAGLTTVLGNVQRGILTETHNGAIALTGKEATGQRGTLSETHPSMVALTTAGAISSTGSVLSSGGDSPDRIVTLTNVYATTGYGVLAQTHSGTSALTSVLGAGAVGAVGFTKSASLGLTSVTGLGQTGTPISALSLAPLLGISTSTGVGLMGKTIALVHGGVEARFDVGILGKSSVVDLSGTEGVGESGGVSAKHVPDLVYTEFNFDTYAIAVMAIDVEQTEDQDARTLVLEELALDAEQNMDANHRTKVIMEQEL